MNKINPTLNKFTHFLSQNMVLIIFVVLSIGGIILANQPLTFLFSEITNRFSRNTFLVLSLIIPVVAGMGLNFGIVIGAMAGQMAIIAVTHWGIVGIGGFALALLISTPLAIIFGYLTGKILNKTKGNEMITTMILGFFANGIYQFIYLFLVGNVIPMSNPNMMLDTGVGIKNTIDLTDGLKYSLDKFWMVTLDRVVNWGLIVVILFATIMILKNILEKKGHTTIHKIKTVRKYIVMVIVSILLLVLIYVSPALQMALKFSDVPVMTWILILLLCLFNTFILKTKLGQDFRTVGQSNHIAKVAGINVNRTRIIAIIISTIFAAWGQVIYLQNIGTLNTYASHEQVGTFAVAAIVVGGASVMKATNKQAIIGVLLFHSLFTVSPMAGKELFNDPQIGEYFRVFLAYGVIAISLALHAWKTMAAHKKCAEENGEAA